jgi:hypothetical protein
MVKINLSMTGPLHFSVYTVRKIQPNDRMRAEKEEGGNDIIAKAWM